MLVKYICYILILASTICAGPNASAIVEIDMDTSRAGIQSVYCANQENAEFSVAVRISNCNTEQNLNFFTVQLHIDTSKYTYVKYSFHTASESNILGASVTSPGEIQSDTSIQIGGALFTAPYPTATEGLLGVVTFASKLSYYDSLGISVEEVLLSTPEMNSDTFKNAGTGTFKILPAYTLTVTHSGVGSTSIEGDTVVTQGDTIEISAIQTGNDYFVSWTVNSGSAVVLDPVAAATQIILTQSDAVIEAKFEPVIEVVSQSKSGFQDYQLSACATNMVHFNVPYNQYITISLTDVQGKTVSRLYSGEVTGGSHDLHVGNLPAGVYVCRMKAGVRNEAIQMIIR